MFAWLFRKSPHGVSVKGPNFSIDPSHGQASFTFTDSLPRIGEEWCDSDGRIWKALTDAKHEYQPGQDSVTGFVEIIDKGVARRYVMEFLPSIPVSAHVPMPGASDPFPLGGNAQLCPDDLVRHAVIWGATGSGKTGLLLGIVESVVAQGTDVLLFDTKGDLAHAALADRLVPSTIARQVAEGQPRGTSHLFLSRPRRVLDHNSTIDQVLGPGLTIVRVPFDTAEAQRSIARIMNAVMIRARRWGGCSRLRYLIAIDEARPFFPPVANPPSKVPIMRVISQGRAFGVGMLVATQSVSDTDYKVLTNCGAVFVGRLGSQQDIDNSPLEPPTALRQFRYSQDGGTPVVFRPRTVTTPMKGPLYIPDLDQEESINEGDSNDDAA